MEQMMRITTKITIPSLMMPEKSTKENYIGFKKFYYFYDIKERFVFLLICKIRGEKLVLDFRLKSRKVKV